MKKTVSVMLVLALLMYMCAGCASAKNTHKEHTLKMSFPIRMISGEADLQVIVLSYKDYTVGALSASLAGDEAQKKIAQSNKEARSDNSYKEILNVHLLKKVGDMYSYDVKSSHKITVIVTPKADDTSFECSGKTYVLAKADKPVYLSFYK
jgi:hypothetical protein